MDISRSFDGGFLTFVLPLILDGMFHKMAPALFMPNTIQMLQKEDWTFSQVGAEILKAPCDVINMTFLGVLRLGGWALLSLMM